MSLDKMGLEIGEGYASYETEQGTNITKYKEVCNNHLNMKGKGKGKKVVIVPPQFENECISGIMDSPILSKSPPRCRQCSHSNETHAVSVGWWWLESSSWGKQTPDKVFTTTIGLLGIMPAV